MRLPLFRLVPLLLISPLAAQAPRAMTAADYARAERFLGGGFTGLYTPPAVAPTWLPDNRFWYRSGSQYLLVDPVKKTRTPIFDPFTLAGTLQPGGGAVDMQTLNLTGFQLSPDGKTMTFGAGGKQWSCDAKGTKCTASGAAAPAVVVPAGGVGGRGAGGRGAGGGRGGRSGGGLAASGEPLSPSPDGRRGVFVRDWNLWLRDVATGQERQLTRDGTRYFGYATDNAGWSGSANAMVAWAPDSRHLATQQQDERNVGEMYLVSTPVATATSPPRHPVLRVAKFPLPGDSVMAMLHRVVIDVQTGTIVRLQMPPDYHRSTREDDIVMTDYKWSPDASRLVLASMARFNNHVWISEADPSTGAVRKVFEEKQATQYKAPTGWQVLWGTNEVLWYSERDNWGQLYLYDLASGSLKQKVTSGEGPVTAITRLDEATRTLWFAANGREKGQDPYFSHLYRINLDGTRPVSLTPDDGTHTVQFSPDTRYLIDTYSKPDVPPTITLRDGLTGKLILPLEKGDVSKLLAAGWKPPIPIRVTAHDGKTDIYGMMFVPTNLDPAQKYPIINNNYPGPQSGSVGSRAFTPFRGDRQALAELGFVVVTIDGMGTPGRSKSFQDSYYGHMGTDNTIPDQIAGMKELAQRYPYIDIERTGIWGHSGGGFATTTAMFRFPDFWKVGISESGNHDQRLNEDDWGERYQGELVRNPDGSDNYSAEANQMFAKNLKGHLLLAHGSMDTNVPPYQTLMVADQLIKANKMFDLLIIPNANHGYATAGNYMMRRRWDYFVKWLLNAEPPENYVIGAAGGGGRGGN